jgi:glutaminyl-peptide cyclotransferase
MKQLLPFLFIIFFIGCNNNDDSTTPDETPAASTTGIPAPKVLSVMLLAEYPHDTAAFTEGLFVHNGKMYESTGLEKQSMIQINDIKTGKTEKKYPIKDSTIFGEGINIFKDKLYQLTYQNHLVFVYNLNDLSKPIKTFPWQSEGWGMTNNGTELIISDGGRSGNLYFVNPEDFKIKRIIQVTDNYGPVDSVNELEYINGTIFANVWGRDHILQIDPSNGHVIGKIETSQVLKSFYASYPINWQDLNNVPNGIAYDSTSKKIYITGKRWPKLFELQFN